MRLWHDEEGWGVVDSAATPGGFAYRALRIRPVGEQPVLPPVSAPGAAHTSTLELTVDDERSP